MLRRSGLGRCPCAGKALLAILLAAQGAWPLSVARAQPASPPDTSATNPQDDSLDLDDMPDIGIDWPDLDAPSTVLTQDETTGSSEGDNLASETTSPLPQEQASGQPAIPGGEAAQAPTQSDILAGLDPAQPLRYQTRLEGLSDVADGLFHTRFDMLSALRQGQGKRANIAQIRRRAQTDEELVDELLRAKGYYEGRTRVRFGVSGGADPHVDVVLAAVPGRRYNLDAIDILGLDGSTPSGMPLRSLFPLMVGDPADTDAIFAATTTLRVGLEEGGYPFADVREPVLTVDHQQQQALLGLNVETGNFLRFGEIRVNDGAPFDARHVAVISRFSRGQPFKQSEVADLDRAIIATGLVSQLKISPQESADGKSVDIDISMTPAPPRTIAGEIGYGTGEGARIEARWQHRNLLPPEGAVTLRGVLGTQEQGLIALFRRNNLWQRDQALNSELSIANVNQPAYDALTVGASASLERHTNLIFQKQWTWSTGVELRVSDERRLFAKSLVPVRRRYVIAALPASLTHDGSDDLLDPRRGFRLGGRLSPELSLQDGAFGYVRAQIDGSGYIPVGDRLTLAGRVRVGTIVGASADRIAPTRRYYAGGGGSVRGYGYQAIGPRDINNDPEGGRSLGEISIEARYRFGSMNQFGIVPFIDAGTISPQPLPTLSEMRVGAGLGFRYYSSFGPIRIDLGTPLNPQPGDSRIGVYVSLGQAF
jgi:translocation and assembly module TamA